jgi:hypothetical protein
VASCAVGARQGEDDVNRLVLDRMALEQAGLVGEYVVQTPAPAHCSVKVQAARVSVTSAERGLCRW